MATELTVIDMPYQGSLDYTANATAVDTELDYFFLNNGSTILVVDNQAMATNDVVITSVSGDKPGTENLTVTVAAQSVEVFGPFEPLWWNIGESVYVTFENDTTINVAALNLTF